ncbi:MAG: hypothetical protein LLF94_00720 [Chlamydiales bacterium]|nr:hypothetical protein [Chlamydiales bacterium]
MQISRLYLRLLSLVVALVWVVAPLQALPNQPTILSNHDSSNNTLKDSVYGLVESAESCILVVSFSLTDSHLLGLLNQKAADGIDVQLVIDRDHVSPLSKLHPYLT